MTRQDPVGRFIVLEGVEGAGKTTQIGLLGAWLAEAGVPHRLTREPGGTAVGEAIRGVLLGQSELDVPPEVELLLVLAARAALVRRVIRPALARGEVVLADRYDLSTFAYQGYGRGLDLAEIERLNSWATGGLHPDLYVVLDVSVEAGRERQRRDGKGADRIEAAGGDFLERVRRGYLELAAAEPRARVVGAGGTQGAVQGAVREVLLGTFPDAFPGGG